MSRRRNRGRTEPRLKNPRRLAEARRVLDLATSAQLRGDYATASRHHLRLLQLGEPGAAAFYHGFIRYRIHRDYEAGEKLFRHAIACGVDTHTAWHNLACCLRDQGRLPEAQALYLRAIERNPAAVESLNGYANTAYELGEVEAAQKAWERAFTLAPTINDPAQQYDLAIQYLTFGEYGVGWHLHRARWAAPLFTTNHLRPQGPEWDGKPVRTLLAIAEQGHGDAIMTMRWVPFMLERAERVHLAVHAGLVALVKRSFPDALVQRLEDPPPPYDAHVSLFDMPAIAGIEKPEDVPGQPYLDAEPAGVAPGRFRAGLVWAGGRDTHHDWRRSIPFSTIAPLLDTKGIGWHVLQLDRLEEFDAAQRKELVWHRDIGPLPNWYATARALKSLNLLITVDTGIAHLAGALGVPTWLLLPRLADYRWGLSGSATPWYPAMRLFRATKALDWRDVITDVQAALAEWTLAREAA